MYRIAGILSLALLAAALNLLAWTQSPFNAGVLFSLAGSAIAGLAWLVLLFTTGTARSVLEGRAIGGLNAVVSSLFFLGICVVAYAFAESNDQSWDLTREGRRELAPQTIQVLQSMNQEVRVIGFFLNVDDELANIGKEKTERFVAQCQQYSPLLQWEVQDPQVAVATMEDLGINFASPQGTIVIKSGSRQRVITLQGGSPRLEERDFTNALINVLRDAEPKVYYLTGHDERDLQDSKTPAGAGGILEILTRESYQVEPLSIGTAHPTLPEDADILVVNNPKGDLRQDEIAALDDFVERGGRMLFLLDPWVRVDHGLAQREFLRPWLRERFGIAIDSDLVLSESGDNRFETKLDFDQTPYLDIDEMPPAYRGSYHAEHPITRGFDQLMAWQASRSVSVAEDKPKNVAALEIVRTLPATWGETRLVELQKEGTAVIDPDEAKGPLPLVVAAARERESKVEDGRPRDARVVVIGNSSFAANGQVTFPGNINFLLNAFAWLSESEDLIAIRPSGVSDPPLMLDDTQRRVVLWVSCLLTMQLFAAAGAAVYLLRGRNQ
ncbi:MAG: hypothetical protein GC168_10700 [Candidatus Hydrogenedens sp.]|nr:hypothetical protein [Candidatus Hydrogenedens sp.]